MAFTLLNVLAPIVLLAVAALWVFLRSRPDLRSLSNVRLIRCASMLAVLLVCGQAFAWLRRASVDTPADFRFINRGGLTTLDPNRMSWMQDIRVGYALWEGLYMLDAQTLDPVPGAAEKVDVSDDQLTWTFHMRKNGKWSNGDPVTSADFVFAWRRMLEQPGDYTYLISKNIKGGDDYSKAAIAYLAAYSKWRDEAIPLIKDKKQPGQAPAAPKFETVGIRAPDAQTLVVTLEHPVSIFPDLVAFPPYFPLNEQSMR